MRETWKLTAVLLAVLLCWTAGSQSELRAQNQEESPLLVEPDTPEEMFKASLLMVRLGRPQLAAKYLQQFAETNPSDELLLKLYDQEGPASFLRLANVKELQPLAGQLNNRVTTAFRAEQTRPERIEKLIEQLGGTPQEREVAVLTLRNAGPAIIPQIIRILASPISVEQRNQIAYALIRLGRQNVPALLGTLYSKNDDLRITVLDVLGYLGSEDILPYLWGPAFSPAEPLAVQQAARQAIGRITQAGTEKVNQIQGFGVARELRRSALSYFRGQHTFETNEAGNAEIWTWIPQRETVGLVELPPEAASIYYGSRFARQALELAPEEPETQALFLGMALAAASFQTAPGESIPTGPGTAHDLALSSGVNALNDALSLALKYGNSPAAIATLQSLALVGTRHQLQKTSAEESPILSALNYPDQRVQLNAAVTILQLDPVEAFPGASRVVEILARAATDDGTLRALVIHPNVENATTYASYLAEIGYEPLIAGTGQQGFKLASERGDISVIALSVNTVRWPLSQTIANLRADARTARIPIVLIGPEKSEPEIQYLINRYGMIVFAPEAMTSGLFLRPVKPFLEGFESPQTAEQRAIQAQAAVYWLGQMATGLRSRLYDLKPAQTALFEATNDPTLTRNALIALSGVGTVETQKRLFQLVTSAPRSLEERELAALQLSSHIQRFGLLLSKVEILTIRQLWQTTQEPEFSTALATVIGTFQPDRKAIQEQLRQFPELQLPVPE